MRNFTFTDVECLEPRVEEAEVALQMDEDAFRAFYDRTSRSVWLYLTRMTHDAQQADDLLQETYYRFHRAGAAYESESHRRNALFRIATNLARDAARRRRIRRCEPLPDEGAIPGDEMAAARTERRADLARALEQLKPAQREMLWLAYAQGLSHQEIASAVGVGTGSVKPLLLRARRRLAELLGPGRRKTR